MAAPVVVEEEWFSLDLESKLNKKIDTLQSLVHQQNDRTHQLLEELKLIKQRELNMMLREKIPVPFFSTKSSFPNQNGASIPSLPSPLFLAQYNRNAVKAFNL